MCYLYICIYLYSIYSIILQIELNAKWINQFIQDTNSSIYLYIIQEPHIGNLTKNKIYTNNNNTFIYTPFQNKNCETIDSCNENIIPYNTYILFYAIDKRTGQHTFTVGRIDLQIIQTYIYPIVKLKNKLECITTDTFVNYPLSNTLELINPITTDLYIQDTNTTTNDNIITKYQNTPQPFHNINYRLEFILNDLLNIELSITNDLIKLQDTEYIYDIYNTTNKIIIICIYDIITYVQSQINLIYNTYNNETIKEYQEISDYVLNITLLPYNYPINNSFAFIDSNYFVMLGNTISFPLCIDTFNSTIVIDDTTIIDKNTLYPIDTKVDNKNNTQKNEQNNLSSTSTIIVLVICIITIVLIIKFYRYIKVSILFTLIHIFPNYEERLSNKSRKLLHLPSVEEVR